MIILCKKITKKYLTEKNFNKALEKYNKIGKVVYWYSDDHYWIIEALLKA